MSLSLSEVDAITHKHIRPKMVNNYFGSKPLYVKLWNLSKVIFTGGTKIQQPIICAKGDGGGAYAKGDPLSLNTVQKYTGAQWDLKFYYQSANVDNTDLLQASGEAAEIKLIAVETEIARLSIQDNVSGSIFGDGSGTSGKEFVGIKPSIGAVGAGIYGVIDPADMTTWQAGGATGGVDSTTVALTPSIMNDQYLKACHGDEEPNFSVTTKAIYGICWSFLQPHQRYGGDDELVRAGFKSHLLFNNATIVHDAKCTAKYLYFLNLNFFEFHIHRDRSFNAEPWRLREGYDVIFTRIWLACALICIGRMYQSCFTAIEG
jgi:hypothetical protein